MALNDLVEVIVIRYTDAEQFDIASQITYSGKIIAIDTTEDESKYGVSVEGLGKVLWLKGGDNPSDNPADTKTVISLSTTDES